MTDKSPQQANGNAGAQRPGFRGKCLYKTGKCSNERALKTSGAAHNLCDEHRHRQNEHQRKLDAKNRTARKDKRPGSASPSPKAEGGSPVSSGAGNTAPAGRSPHAISGARYAPYDKNALPHRALRGENGGSEDDGKAAHGLALPSTGAALAGVDPTTTFSHHEAGANGAGVVYHMPNGPQPPQMAYPFGLQDFDGIVVPLPSYLEGPERSEFRSRIYQKVLDFISEECVLRFGARPMDKHFQHLQPQQLPLAGSMNSNSSSGSNGALPADVQASTEVAEMTDARASSSPAKVRRLHSPIHAPMLIVSVARVCSCAGRRQRRYASRPRSESLEEP